MGVNLVNTIKRSLLGDDACCSATFTWSTVSYVTDDCEWQ